MNELVSPYTQYLYHHFNGYTSTRLLIQNRCTACFLGLLTIIRNVKACCQITESYLQYFPAFDLYQRVNCQAFKLSNGGFFCKKIVGGECNLWVVISFI